MQTITTMRAVLFCITSFVLGTALGLRISAAPSAVSPVNPAAIIAPQFIPAEQLAQQPDDREEVEYIDLPQDYPLRAKYNGKRLKLHYNRLRGDEKKGLLKEAKVQPLADGRMLAKLDNTLYMLDAAGQVRWQYKANPRIIDFVIAESAGLVYGIADDNVFFILELATGKCLLSESHNGRTYYSQILPYGKDGCFVIMNTGGYRESDEWTTSKMVVMDSLIAYRGTKWLWWVDFPPDAELIIKGKTYYAVTRTDGGIYVRKVHISQLKKH